MWEWRVTQRMMGWALAAGLLFAGATAARAADAEFSTGSTDEIVQFINQQIRQSWKDNEVQPSPAAEDAEWVRRVYLDLVGHIPPVEDAEAFIADKDKAKRSKLIDKLLDDPGYVRNWTTIWTNLCIGQQTPRFVSRDGMQKFFREAFGRNRPWKDIVSDLVTAEGHYEQNGAVNFILAQMQDRDDGVQLTAKTCRLFMGMQVQCTQCHNHPFNDWKQDQFWQFNSFFRQTDKQDHRKFNPQTGRMEDDYAEVKWRDFNGPVYFEKRNGLMQVAFPIYLGSEIDPGASTERRKELAKLMTTGDKPMIALALVNRLWGHFFSYGFTRPIDDIGPHNPATHPELMDRLAEEFVKSGYDMKQLMRWITNSEAYNLTSKGLAKKNDKDNPAAGETALFTHVYVKPMTAEQLYDSLIVATNAHKSGRSGWEQSERQRQQWMRQFVNAFGNDMAEESNSFDGTIPQALMMMNTNPKPNGEQPTLMSGAVSLESGSHLTELLTSPSSDVQKIQKLYMSALTRMPSRAELNGLQRFVKGSRDQKAAYQDIFWALLNSNEFILVH